MKISFWGAVREVTGSCHLIEIKDSQGKLKKVLIDCGMFQGERFSEEKNHQPFPFDPAEIDVVLITHAHLDHVGRLPKLIQEGYKGEFIMVLPTCPLAKLVLEDAFHIMEENARRLNEPILYSHEDVEAVHARCRGINYHEEITIASGITVMFHDAGHILGSAYVSIEAEGKRVVFSGDIGNDDVPILAMTEPLSRADVVVCESTYGHTLHEPAEERQSKVKNAIEETIKKKGTLLIPAFSIERTQELLYVFNEMFLKEIKTNIPIYLDSPMAIRATELYRHFKNYLQFAESILSDPDHDFFTFPNLVETLTTEESKKINEVSSPKVIVAGSGMMNGGRIMHHLIRVLSDAENIILIIGYQAVGTLGRRLFEGAREVRIYGQTLKVKAKIDAVGAFSAHGDQAKLTRWLQPEDKHIPKKIFLVHGDSPVLDVFATHLRHTLQTEIVVPEIGNFFEI